MRKSILGILILVTSFVWSQKCVTSTIHGKIVADVSNLEGIYVINATTEKSVMTKSGGYFDIQATEGDTLVFSAVQYKGKRIAVLKEDFDKELLFVKMEMIINHLDEVMIMSYKNINAVALGIIPKGQKSYTPAERKLRTATGLDARIGLNTSFSIDPLFNLLSGRTAELLKNIEVERKQYWLDKIAETFSEKLFIDKFKIPIDYIKGFQYYIVENKNFVDTLKSKNTAMSSFLMGELAVKYNEMIACE